MLRVLRYIKNNPENESVMRGKWLIQSLKNTANYTKDKNKVEQQERNYNNLKEINNILANMTPREARSKWLSDKYSAKAFNEAKDRYLESWVPKELRSQAPYEHRLNTYNAYRLWETLPDLEFTPYKKNKTAEQYFKEDLWNMNKEISDYLNAKASYEDLASIPLDERTIEQQMAKDKARKKRADAKNNLRISL